MGTAWSSTCSPVWTEVRVLAALGAALVGAGLAVAGVAVHRLAWRVGVVAAPWGLALAVATPVACGVAVRQLRGGRLLSGALAVGWLLVVMGVVGGRPEGDFAIAADWMGWGFLVLGGGSLAALAGWSLFVPPRKRAADSGSGGA